MFILEGGYFTEAAEVTVGLAEFGGEKGLDQIPRHGRPHRAATQTQEVYVIVLDALPCRKVVFDQTGANPFDLIGAHGSPDAAAANGDTALQFPGRHRLRQRDDEVGIVVLRGQHVSAEIEDFMTRRAQLGGQRFLELKPAMIGGDSHAHVI